MALVLGQRLLSGLTAPAHLSYLNHRGLTLQGAGSREQALTSEVSEGVMPTVRRAQEWRGGEQVKGEPGDLEGLWAVSEP